jgi:hypothetical protein
MVVIRSRWRMKKYIIQDTINLIMNVTRENL